MNKPQYLAEFGQLLIFMTRADREKTLACYAALFDAAGEGGQQALLEKLGSTTRQAIRLSRIYDAAGYEDPYLAGLERELTEKAPVAPAPAQPAALSEEELPSYDLADLPDLQADGAPAEEPDAIDELFSPSQPAPEKPVPEKAAPAPQPVPAEAEEKDPDKDAEEELWGKRPAAPAPAKADDAHSEPDEEDEDLDEDLEDEEDDGVYEDEPPRKPAPPAPVYAIERTIPLWAGIPLFVLTIIFIVLPVTVLCLLLIPALVVPGAAVLLGAFLAFVGGLWCISIIADAAVLFGTALILLGLGLIVLWWGLWLDVAMVTLYGRALVGLAHLTLGRKVTVHA